MICAGSPKITDSTDKDTLKKLAIAWGTLAALCALGALNYFLLSAWYENRPHSGSAAPEMPVLGFAIDYVFPIWLMLPILGCAASIITAVISWRSFRNFRKSSHRGMRLGILGTGAILASVAAVVLAMRILPSAFGVELPRFGGQFLVFVS